MKTEGTQLACDGCLEKTFVGRHQNKPKGWKRLRLQAETGAALSGSAARDPFFDLCPKCVEKVAAPWRELAPHPSLQSDDRAAEEA